MDDARLAKKERNQAWLASVTLLVFIAAWPACDHADSIQGQETDAGDDLSAPEAGALSPPLVSGESTPIPDANAGIGPERQQYLAVAVGASQALLAWADNRSDPAGYGGSDILAVRYAVDGTLLDIAPIRIAATHDNETSPSVAFGGGMFFVTWDAMNRSPNGDQQRSWLRGTRLSVDGTVLDPDGLEIAADAYAASVAFVEDRFMVAYEGTLGARPLSVRSVSLSGTVDAVPVLIHESGTEPRMATDGQHALLFYRFEAPERSLRLQLLRADATTEKEITWPTTGWSAALTGSPSGFAALWTDDGHAMLRRLDTNGQWTDDAPIAHQCSGAVRDGEGTLLACSPLHDLSIARLADSTDVIGPAAVVPGATNPVDLRTASDGTTRVIGWSEEQSLYHVRVDPTGASLDPVPVGVPHGTVAQVDPALGTVQGKPFLAFCEASGLAERTVRHVLLDESATGIAGPIFDIPDATAPAIASGPVSTLLVWWAPNGIVAAIVADDGSIGPETVVGTSVFEDSGYFVFVRNPRVAATSEGFVVTYTAEDDHHDWIEAVQLDATGQITSRVSVVGSGLATPVAVGSTVVLALSGDPLSPGTLRVKSLLGTEVLELGPIAPGYVPSLASDGSNALVVWTDDASRRVLGAFVDAMGASLEGPFEISPTGTEAHGATALFDGESFLVVWRQLDGKQADLHGARVSREGEVLDAQGFVVSAEPDHEQVPILAPLPGGAVVAYGRFELGLESVRVRTRTVSSTLR